MTIPLSELFLDIPLVDVESHIRRSKELREQEWMIRRNSSRVSRPLNVFLLYRKAVSARARKYAGISGHQNIAKVTAASWKKEPDRVRILFNRYAELEKKYHEKAFSDYQFYSKKIQSTEVGNSKRKRGYEYQSDCDNNLQYLSYSTQKKKTKVTLDESKGIEQNGSYLWQHTPDGNFKVVNSGHDRLPYSTNWRHSSFGEDHVQVAANHNLDFNVRDFEGNSQANTITSSATTYIKSPRDCHDLLLGSAAVMDHPRHLDGGTSNPGFHNFDNLGEGLEDLVLSTSVYTQVEDFAPSNLMYTQEEEGVWSSLYQNQNWGLDEQSASISNYDLEELFG